jgi:hypothetical protein
MEKSLLFPIFVPLGFDPLGIINFFQNFGHDGPCMQGRRLRAFW